MEAEKKEIGVKPEQDFFLSRVLCFSFLSLRSPKTAKSWPELIYSLQGEKEAEK
jgi:hypothetical protein